jgi:hypothetical protein
VTLSIIVVRHYANCHFAECSYAECRDAEFTEKSFITLGPLEWQQ